MKKIIFVLVTFCFSLSTLAQKELHLSEPSSQLSIFLRSEKGFNGSCAWKIKKASEITVQSEPISSAVYNDNSWLPAIVPGTVLNTLVYNNVYPEPYFGVNNKKTNKRIPDIAEAGIEFYHYWFRTEFKIPKEFVGKKIGLKFHGINYRCDIWVNGIKLGRMGGMFNAQSFDITSIADFKNANVLAVDVLPVDVPGSNAKAKIERFGAKGENKNGGDREIGKNVSMLMSVGWDFTAPDGIRDRNTGIWRDVELFATGNVNLENPFVQTKLALPDTTVSKQTISVEVINQSSEKQEGVLEGFIPENGVKFSKKITLLANERRKISFNADEFKQLEFKNPKLWWPKNKGPQHLYTLKLKFIDSDKSLSHEISTRFGVREITSDQNTPDKSRRFIVNGHPIFIRGTNWVPEAMLRNSEKRTYAELKYTQQSGINLLRLWGGGIAESDLFYQLCDEMGILVWTEFWITGDTAFPTDSALYFKNLTNTVLRIRNHASSAYYVSSNESTEMQGAPKLFHALDSTRGYQMQSECCGVHDGSPYKYENPMLYFENTASARGSRIDGFNPEYGTPCLPTIESLREMMPAADLWPINDSVWNYLDGNGFHNITTKYRHAVDQFGKSNSIEEYAKKAQFVGAMNYRSIWEVWNYNKFNYGDRFCSGFLFWYHNSPVRQTGGRLYDWSLEPTAALYYSQNGNAPLHPQFDYLKNTVSVYNDFRTPFSNYSVVATVYDLNAKQVLTLNSTINIPADGVVNDALKIEFPENISQVHFIKLQLKNTAGKVVADAFYWRSKDTYLGSKTMTGPAIGGFNDINKLAKVTLNFTAKAKITKKSVLIEATVSNKSNTLAFFTQLKLQDTNGATIKPAFYSDNFFSLLPGESKKVTIEVTDEELMVRKMQLVVDGWNVVGDIKVLKTNN
jgi:hypothetical protein